MKINWRLIALYALLLELLIVNVASTDPIINLLTGLASIILAFLAGAFAMIRTGAVQP